MPSISARERYVEFPSLIADDKFIRNLTRPSERRVAGDCYTTVHLPANFHDLLKVKTRWTFGNLELAERRPDLNVNDQGEHDGAMKFVLTRPGFGSTFPRSSSSGGTPAGQRKKLAEKRSGWERDESTRVASVPRRGLTRQSDTHAPSESHHRTSQAAFAEKFNG